MIYHLNYASSPFGAAYFGDRVSLFAQASLGCNPPILKNFLLKLE
jgi:hypothetical protein